MIGHILLFQGCKVIGYAGADDKVKWLKEELGFDFAFNYKKVDLSESLKEAAPDGVDVYFDGVSEMKRICLQFIIRVSVDICLISSISSS